jgi:hypothetical protein
MKFFKKQLLALALMLGGVQFAQALTLDEITPETIATITGNEIGNLLKSLNSTDQITAARQMATSITKETIVKVDARVIAYLLDADENLAQEFAELIDDKEMIVKVDARVIVYLLNADKSLAKQFAQLIDKETIVKVHAGVMHYLLNADKSLAKQFAALIDDKEMIVKVNAGVIHYLLNADKSLAKQFAQLIDKEMLLKHDHHQLTCIYQLIHTDRSLAQKLADLIDKETITKINPEMIKFFLEVDPSLVKQFASLLGADALNNHNSVESQLFAEKINSMQLLSKQLNIPSNLIFKNSKLQSVQHFDTVESELYKDVFKELKDRGITQEDRAMLLRVLHKSRLEEKKGNFTFIHAQVRSFLPLSDIFKRVVELCENKGNSYESGHYPLRFVKPGGKFALDENKITQFLTKGLYGDKEDGVFTLCMNGYLFGSAGLSGRDSLDYWLRNHDQSSNKGLQLNARKMLEVYGLEAYYDRYQKEFELLWDEIAKDGARGNLLLLSLTPEQVKKWVYPSSDNRRKSYFTIDGKQTDDVALVLKTLKTDPKKLSVDDLKYLHYCLVLSDQALDPVNGVKIYPFTSDENYVRAWREKLDALFIKIKSDIAKDKHVQQQKLQPQIVQNKTSGENLLIAKIINNPIVNRRLAVLGGHLNMVNSK